MRQIDDDKKALAIQMRKSGKHIRDIAKAVGIAVGTAYEIVRNVPHTEYMVQMSEDHKEKRRVSAVKARKEYSRLNDAKITKYKEDASAKFDELSKHHAFTFGLGLYAGEGHKREKNLIAVTNTEAWMLRAAKQFFLTIGCLDTRIKAKILLSRDYSSSDVADAKRRWEHELKMPVKIAIKSKCVVSKREIGVIAYYSREMHEKVIQWLLLLKQKYAIVA